MQGLLESKSTAKRVVMCVIIKFLIEGFEKSKLRGGKEFHNRGRR